MTPAANSPAPLADEKRSLTFPKNRVTSFMDDPCTVQYVYVLSLSLTIFH